jgi:hypothetical protein
MLRFAVHGRSGAARQVRLGVQVRGKRSRGEGDSRTVEAWNRDGYLAAIVAARRLAFLNFSVRMSKKRDARRNFSQYLNGDDFMGESVPG